VLALLLAAGPRAAPAGTLDELVAELDGKLDRSLTGRPLPRLDLALSLRPGAGVSEALAKALRQLVKGKLSAKGLRSYGELAGKGGKESERAARARGYELLLDLEATLVEGQLHLQGDLIGTDRVLWRDLQQPDRGSVSHLHASVRADAEVRAFQGSLTSSAVRFSHHSVTFGRVEALALAAGDVDGDGRTDLVMLQPRAVEVLRHKPGGFTSGLRLPLPGPLAAVRPRRALGTLVLADRDRDGRAEILARSSELERGAELSTDGKVLVSQKELAGYPLLLDGAGKGAPLLLGGVLPGQDLLAASALALQPAATAPEWHKQLPASFYALRGVSIAGRKGPRRYLGLVDAGGQLQLFAAETAAPLLQGPRVGAALDLVDLDDNGRLEVVTTGADGPEADDQLAVYRLVYAASGGAQLRLLWRSASLGGQVTDLTHGDFDGDGKQELVAAIRQKGGVTTLMVIQRGLPGAGRRSSSSRSSGSPPRQPAPSSPRPTAAWSRRRSPICR